MIKNKPRFSLSLWLVLAATYLAGCAPKPAPTGGLCPTWHCAVDR